MYVFVFRFKEEFHIMERADGGGKFHVRSNLGGEYIIKTIPLPREYVIHCYYISNISANQLTQTLGVAL